ncbi:2,3,4,5-tetrahydropyridine-2,6-carboxylate N-succinyltransferase [Frigidibacter albus]|uniref:2,3,4,5-tetrahydropyridine-2,6-carboxylate N-succinyltransferase n=1 Tax=Frigidibacter albus TaxID=1465486 RepID=A0A6L8VL85_9RHOB|nr:Hint domain-containing protein [Frigidibacter albus]MZQ90983.1 2,3,4,5-tetrahydropyridine-2,6-carboxylate N-succinyltransferase [Frigidibacter albus]NBE32868.1 2,3,4,5-tetrahydropyridine-2,6-carboxylate N-succinyltransferase [Frigidibacter albus]GGH62422.1 hypothetical protein GCM10011341_36590 [Frigidibacter albus]
MATGSELSYNTNASATQMANTIMGDGVTVVGASYSGDKASSGTYSRGDSRSPEATPSDTGVILSTGHVVDFTQSSGDPNRSSSTSTDTRGIDNNAQFNALAGTNTYDAAMLDVDFIPTGDTMTMTFTFASEEYPEYVDSIYNDMVGVWVNGVPVEAGFGNGDISVTNINAGTAPNLFIGNTNDAYNTEMDGFTVTMTLTFPVIPGQVNSIRIGIADVADSQYDSAVLIAADSLQTTLIAADDAGSVFADHATTLDVLDNDINTAGGVLKVTHINGVAVVPGQTITLPSGDQVKLNADMTLTFTADDDAGEVAFTYTISNGLGKSDIGLITIDTIPCFVAGTMILTPQGEVAVEALQPGDMVCTKDNGPQPLRWIGRRSVAAEGAFAPIRITAGTFGDHRTLTVSPLHRILIRDRRAELLFGEAEVLVAARDLVDDARVRAMPGGSVEYVHLLFDQHQVVFSEGLPTESFLPGPQLERSFEAEIVAEICTLFPELDPATGGGYSAAARRTLRRFEARLLQPLPAAA